MIVICYYLSRKIPSPFGKRASQGRRKPPCGSTGRISRTARGPIGIQCFLVPPCGRPFPPTSRHENPYSRLHGRGPAVPGPCAVPVSISNPVRNASPSHGAHGVHGRHQGRGQRRRLGQRPGRALCRRAGGARRPRRPAGHARSDGHAVQHHQLHQRTDPGQAGPQRRRRAAE